MTLSSGEIEKILPNKVLKRFKGIFMSDEIPKRDIGYYIFNLDNSKGDYSGSDKTSIGNHWVALNVEKEKSQYFDPYGESPLDSIMKWLKRGRPKYPIWYNTSQIQDISSNKCGWYVIDFLTDLSKGVSFYDAIHKYDIHNTKTNEKIIEKKYHL